MLKVSYQRDDLDGPVVAHIAQGEQSRHRQRQEHGAGIFGQVLRVRTRLWQPAAAESRKAGMPVVRSEIGRDACVGASQGEDQREGVVEVDSHTYMTR